MIPAPMPSPVAVYHYDVVPQQTCMDDLTGTVRCYSNDAFKQMFQSLSALPAGINTVPAAIDISAPLPHLQLPCVEDEPRIKGVDTTGWLQLYDKHDHLLGEIQCQRGRIIVRKVAK